MKFEGGDRSRRGDLIEPQRLHRRPDTVEVVVGRHPDAQATMLGARRGDRAVRRRASASSSWRLTWSSRQRASPPPFRSGARRRSGSCDTARARRRNRLAHTNSGRVRKPDHVERQPLGTCRQLPFTDKTHPSAQPVPPIAVRKPRRNDRHRPERRPRRRDRRIPRERKRLVNLQPVDHDDAVHRPILPSRARPRHPVVRRVGPRAWRAVRCGRRYPGAPTPVASSAVGSGCSCVSGSRSRPGANLRNSKPPGFSPPQRRLWSAAVPA